MHRWVLLVAQLPASRSSPRVTLWRRARAAGAIGLQNGVWVLPHAEEYAQFFTGLADTVREQGGSAFVLSAATVEGSTEAEIVERFRADRAREYEEFGERSAELLAEIDKESGRAKFTFAELEEIEQELDKLTRWLAKITARDFFPNERTSAAANLLRRCRDALDGFARAVYEVEGLSGASEPEDEPETDGRARS